MSLLEACESIRSMEIQGAHDVTVAAIEAIKDVADKSKATVRGAFVSEIEHAKQKLIATRPTEPGMRNALNYIVKQLKSMSVAELKEDVIESVTDVALHLRAAEKAIAREGASLIRDGRVIFTHCHSSTVVAVLEKAWSDGKRFEVYNTETRPRLQGRITARELAKIGIPVTHFVDSGADEALERSHLMMIGADAVTFRGGVVNKIGSDFMAKAACINKVPVYVCTDSWKYDPVTEHRREKIENRNPAEIWPKAPAGIKVRNPAFELVKPQYIKAIVSECGILRPHAFVRKAAKGF